MAFSPSENGLMPSLNWFKDKNNQTVDLFDKLSENDFNKKIGKFNDAVRSGDGGGDLKDFYKEQKKVKDGFIPFIKNLDGATATYKDYTKSVETANKAQETQNKLSFGQQAGQTLKSAGSNILSGALNMATGMAISAVAGFAINGVITLLDNWINRSENLIETGKKAKSEIDSLSNEYKSHEQTIKNVLDTYDDYRTKVDQKTNKNNGLTDEKYQDFLNQNNALAELAPDIVSKYDAQGNAIVDLGDSAADATIKLNGLLLAQREMTNYKISKQAQDQYKGIQESVNKLEKQKKALKQSSKDKKELSEAVSADGLSQGLDNNKITFDPRQKGSAEIMKSLKKALRENNVFYEPEQVLTGAQNELGEFLYNDVISVPTISAEAKNKVLESVSKETKNVAFEARDASNKALREIQFKDNEIAGKWAELAPTGVALLQSSPSFRKFDTSFQDNILNMIPNLDWASVKEQYNGDIEDFITQGILEPMATGGKETRNAFNELFELEKNSGDLSIKEWTDKRDELIKRITGGDKEQTKGLLQNLGYLDSNGNGKVRKQLDIMEKALGGVDGVRSKLREMSRDEFEIAYDIIINDDDDAINTVSSLMEAIEDQRVKNSEPIDISISDTNKVLSSINAINSALASQGTGKSISIEEFNSDELKEYSSALEYNNGCLQLNADKVKELAKAKAEEKISANDVSKTEYQKEYLKNAKEIEELRQKIKQNNLSEDELNTSNLKIDGLLDNNNTLVNQCDQLDILSASLREATGAYQAWLDGQNAPEKGDMFDSAIGAITHINDTNTNKKSEFYGRTGRTDYKAALNFVIPDTVDKEDATAVQSYVDGIKQYLTFDKNKNMDGLNIDQFCQNAVEKGLMKLDESGENYELAGSMTMEKFAEGMGLALPLVQAMFGEMEEYDGKFDWSDEAIKTLGDLGVEANKAAEELKEIDGNQEIKIQMDVSDIENSEEKIATLDSTIQEMQNLKARPDIDDTSIQNANAVIQYCLAQKQQLSKPEILKVDAGSVDGELSNAIAKLQEFQTAQQELEILAEIGADTSDAQAKVDGLASEIQGMDAEIMATLNVDNISAETISASLAGMQPEVLVNAGVQYKKEDQEPPEDQDSDVNYNRGSQDPPIDMSASVNYSLGTQASPQDKTVKVNYDTSGAPSSGVNGASGSAHASGTARNYTISHGSAYAQGNAKLNGDWGMDTGQRVLIGELGREIVVDPASGRWRTYGDNGAEFAYIPKDAIIFNHLQSESLLGQGYVNGRGNAMMSGTAMASGTAMVTGGISVNQANKSVVGKRTYADTQSSKNSNSSEKVAKAAEKTAEAAKQAMVYVEIILARLKTVTDKFIKLAENAASLGGSLANFQSAINNISSEINHNERGAAKYESKADSIELSPEIKQLIRDGAIEIIEYDDETQKKIGEYQSWHDKILKCRDAIIDLKIQQKELAKQKLDKVVDYYDSKIDIYDQKKSKYEARLDYRKSGGRSQASNVQKKIYKAELKQEKNTLKRNEDGLAKYKKEFNTQVKAGTIKKGSKEYNEGLKQIEAYNTAIYESKGAINDFNTQIRTISFTKFENAVDKAARWVGKLTKIISLKETRGTNTEADYKNQIAANTEGIEKKQALKDKYLKEQKRWNVDSDEYQEYADKIAGIDNDILDLLQSSEDAKKSIVDIRWKPFDEGQEKKQNTIDEVNNLIGLMKSDSFIDDKTGSITKEGHANIALTGEGMKLEKEKIANYRTGLKKLQDQLKNNLISQDVFNQKTQEYNELIQNSVNNISNYKDSLVDLYITQQEKQNELLQDEIKLRKDALKKKKQYYDYDKKLSSKNKDISLLKAQIAALEGVTSASGRNELLHLKEQLAQAEEEKNDLVVEHSYEMQNQSYDEMSENANKALEDITKAMKSNSTLQEQVVTSMLDSITSKFSDAFSTIADIVDSSGLVVSDALSSLLKQLNSVNGSKQVADGAKQNPNDTKSSSTANNVKTDDVKTGNAATSAAEKALGQKENTTNRPVVAITLDKKSATIKVGKTVTVKVKEYLPTDAKTAFKWTTDKASVATVSNSGKVKGLKSGSATITCASGSAKASCTVKVEAGKSTLKAKATLKSAVNGGSNVATLANKTPVTVSAIANDSKGNTWYKVKGDGKSGWVGSTKVNAYAKGTNYADEGWAKINELGDELVMRSNGQDYSYLTHGSKVFTAKETENLLALSHLKSGDLVQGSNSSSVYAPNTLQQSTNVNVNLDSFIGNIESMDKSTIESLRKQIVPLVTKELTRELGKLGFKR